MHRPSSHQCSSQPEGEAVVQAQALMASLPWPAETRIDVLYVDQFLEADLDRSGRRPSGIRAPLSADVEKHLAAAHAALTRPGRAVWTHVVIGRPASAIADTARRVSADLVVVGSHRHGRFASALLGSVGAEVVDTAPCPVLVARSSRLREIVLAHDGSDGSRQAEDLVARWSFLRSLRMHVISVAPTMTSWYAFGANEAPLDAGVYQQILDDSRAEHQRIASEAATRLAAQGVAALVDLRDGDTVRGVIDAATDHQADLIVIGSRGRTGLARFVLGSVARGVLFGAPCSVLIVRQRVAVDHDVVQPTHDVVRDRLVNDSPRKSR